MSEQDREKKHMAFFLFIFSSNKIFNICLLRSKSYCNDSEQQADHN